MKCGNCGFVYDDEAVCPICGTPAPQPEPVLQNFQQAQPTPYFAQPAPTIEQPAPQQSPAPQEQTDDKQPKQSKGLKIATLCVLAVIAAALVYSAVLQTISFLHERRYEEMIFGDDFDYDFDFDGGDFDYIEPQTFNDSEIHAIGESFDFGKGTVALQSAKIIGPYSAGDNTKQLVAFTVVLTNNSDSEQTYSEPYIELGDSVFDEENYRYTEYDESTDSYESRVKKGESVTYVYYYSIPKDNQKLECSLDVYSYDEMNNYSAHTTYEFETKDIK